jgi:hypothetical protein
MRGRGRGWQNPAPPRPVAMPSYITSNKNFWGVTPKSNNKSKPSDIGLFDTINQDIKKKKSEKKYK